MARPAPADSRVVEAHVPLDLEAPQNIELETLPNLAEPLGSDLHGGESTPHCWRLLGSTPDVRAMAATARQVPERRCCGNSYKAGGGKSTHRWPRGRALEFSVVVVARFGHEDEVVPSALTVVFAGVAVSMSPAEDVSVLDVAEDVRGDPG